MKGFLNQLIDHDSKLMRFNQHTEIIQQGLAPLLAQTNKSLMLQKANLLEQNKLQNWKSKAQILFGSLSKHNIDFLVFKGFAFTYLLYQSSHLRPYSDIDIIIDKSNYDKTKEILLQLGYQLYPSRQGRFVSFQNSFYDGGSPQTVIDLHWQINNRIEFHKHFDFLSLFTNAQTLSFDETTFNTLANIDAFILGCFHFQAHRPQDRKHIWLYDLALLWKTMPKLIQEQCLSKAKITQQLAIVHNTLRLINSTFLDCFKLELDDEPPNNEATGFYLEQRDKKLADIKTRLINIHGLNNKLKFLSEYIFQSKQYVKQRFDLNSKRWVYLYYPKMWLQDFFKLFK